MRSRCLVALLLASNLSGRAATNPAEVVQMLVPGFTVEEVPVPLSNQNNLRFAPDGTLTALGYDGKIWRLRDTNGDGLEDRAEPFWEQPTLSVPLGMAWSTRGLYVSSKGKVSLLRDTDGDDRADEETVIASGWPPTDVGSGGVDATAVTLDLQGNVYFGLLVADYSNAYRLRKRKDLKSADVDALKERSQWREPDGPDAGEDQFSLYDPGSARGTIQKWDPRTRRLEIIATGIRVPVALAFNRAGDLFNTDQEGETWMPNGNPLDELNHIVAGRNYGFPPRHEKWLPRLVSEAPAVAFGPQHQSACGLVFNDPHDAFPKLAEGRDASVALPAAPSQRRFGPESWEGNAFVAGESRGKIWRVPLVKTAAGYVGLPQIIARLSMLTVDLAISPRGDLYVACHSGPPDWGTGPRGQGRVFRIRFTDPLAPVPVAAVPTSSTEVRITFEQPLHPEVIASNSVNRARIEFGEYVTAGDRFEVLKPPYAVVPQQDSTPRGQLAIHRARIEDDGRTLVLTTDPHPLAVRYAATLPGIRGRSDAGPGRAVDLDYDLTRASQPLPKDLATITPQTLRQPLAWAPAARASAGTDSRPSPKPTGDWERGRSLFASVEFQCARCHRVRGEGGTAGPDLSNLVHRDYASVLRDIREPSATLHPDYVTYQVETRSGESMQGFMRAQGEDVLGLFDAEGKETRWARAELASVRPTELSLMPSGLLDGPKENDVRDLLTFLMWAPPDRSREKHSRRTEPASAPPPPDREMRLVLVASRQDHGAGQHDYPRWQTNWSRWLSNAAQRTVTETAWQWPSEAQFSSASVIVFYCWNHDWSSHRLAQLDAFLARGGGVASIHSAVIADREPEALAERLGLSANPARTGYRHMPFELELTDREHPLTRGLPARMYFLDEPYWPLIGNPARVRVLASAKVDGALRPLIWTHQKGAGRVFVSIVGHYTWSLEDPWLRTILLRGIAWAAGEPEERLEALAPPAK